MVYRKCRGCNETLDDDWYTNNQWSKGEGNSRCTDCVRNDIFYTPEFVCRECGREFTNQNNLNMHMQVHRPREFRCPICGDVRFKSPANAVQHVESGSCSGCLGRDNARRQIYDYVQRNAGGSNPMLTNGGSHSYRESVPDFPYQCQECAKSFRNLSQLMQHMDQKHNRMRMLGY